VPGEPAFPRLREGSPPSVAHGHDIDNILSIGVPQAPRQRTERPAADSEDGWFKRELSSTQLLRLAPRLPNKLPRMLKML